MDKREQLARNLWDAEQAILPMPHSFDDPKSEPYKAHWFNLIDRLLAKAKNNPELQSRIDKVLDGTDSYAIHLNLEREVLNGG